MTGSMRPRRKNQSPSTQPAVLSRTAVPSRTSTARQRRERREVTTSRRSYRTDHTPVNLPGHLPGHLPGQRSRNLPPVMVREGNQADMAVPPRKAPFRKDASFLHPSRSGVLKPRRRYDLALNVPGAEVRLPSLPALHFSWRLASGMLILFMAVCLYFLLFTPIFQIDVLQVEGLQRLTFDEVISQLSVIGQPAVLVSPSKVEQELANAFPEFSSLQAKVYLPARIKLEVVERTPVLAWILDGTEHWIDATGVSFPPRGDPGSPTVPSSLQGSLVRVEADGYPLDLASQPGEEGAAPRPTLSAELVSTLLSMGNYLPEGAAILYNSEHGFGWTDPHGWNVYFGKDLEQMDQKLLVYQALSDRLLNDGIQPTFISLEFLHAPFYRR